MEHLYGGKHTQKKIMYTLFIYLILAWGYVFWCQREEGRDRNINVREKHRSVDSRVAPGIEPATRYMFDQELNLLQFGVWDDTQPTEPPGNTYIYWYRTTSMTYYWRERKLQNT